MRIITVSIKQYRELQRLMSEMGNSPLICKGEMECYDNETKAKWDTETVTFMLSEEQE